MAKMCYKKGTKKVSAKKYEFGTQKMFVPPKADLGDVLAPASSLGSLGMQVGGPIGGAVGAGLGLTIGAATAIQKNKQANAIAAQNKAIDTYNNQMDRTIDPRLQQKQVYGGGSSGLKTEKPKTPKEQGEENRKKRAEKFKNTPNVDDKINQEAIKYGKNEHGLPKGDQQFRAEKKAIMPKYRFDEYGNGSSSLKKGSKVIEVEEKELIFQKDPQGKFILREDHKESPTHEEGGEKTLGIEGDVIFPGNMRTEVMEAYNKGDHGKLEEMRKSLPADTKAKFATGGEVKKTTTIGDNIIASKTVKKSSTPTFDTSVKSNQKTSSLDIKKTSIDPKALEYTDYTDLTNIKPNKFAFNYPPQPPVGYVPSQYVPDAIGFGNYMSGKEYTESTTPMMNKKMKYRKGTSGLKAPMYPNGAADLITSRGLGPSNLYGGLTRNDYNQGYGDYMANQNLESAGGGIAGSGMNSNLGNIGAGALGNGGGGNKFNFQGAGNVLQTGLELAPTLYNTFKGLSKPVKTQRNFYNPEQYQKIDRYAPERRAAQESYRVEANNLRNMSGGNQGLYLANQAQSANRRFNRLQDINSNLISDYRNVDNANVDLRNQAKQMNLNLTNQYNDMDLQNNAQRQNMMAASTTGASDYTQQRRLDNRLANRDNSLLDIIGTQNYGIDTNPNTGRYKIKYRRGY